MHTHMGTLHTRAPACLYSPHTPLYCQKSTPLRFVVLNDCVAQDLTIVRLFKFLFIFF